MCLIAFWAVLTAMAPARAFEVVFLNPGEAEAGTFWRTVSDTMTAAADDLGAQVDVLYAQRNHLYMSRQVEQVLARPRRPDVAIIVNEKQAAGPMLERLSDAGIPIFVLLNAFHGAAADRLGAPRRKHPAWIGSLVPDNAAAGREMAEALLAAADRGRDGPSEPITLFGLGGDRVTPASVFRTGGFEAAIAARPDVAVLEFDFGAWRHAPAYRLTTGWLRRHGAVDGVWAANDAMALAAMDAARQIGLRPGRDLFVVGMNWSIPAVRLVAQGEMVMTHGGHHLGGAWSIVLLYDYFHGTDFAGRDGAQRTFPMSPITAQNADRFLQALGHGTYDRIDFARFSRVRYPGQADYDFTLERLLRAADPPNAG